MEAVLNFESEISSTVRMDADTGGETDMLCLKVSKDLYWI